MWGAVLKVRRSRWFGHIVRRDETVILGLSSKTSFWKYQDASHLEDERKTWKNKMQDKLARGAGFEYKSVAYSSTVSLMKRRKKKVRQVLCNNHEKCMNVRTIYLSAIDSCVIFFKIITQQ